MLYKIFLYMTLLLMIGCNKHVDNATNSLVGTLHVSPANPKDYNIPVGITKKFAAVYQDKEGRSKDVSKDVVWNSSDSNIATVDKAGNVLALQKGSVFINAKLSNGINAKSSAVNISNPNLINIHVYADHMQQGKLLLELGTQEYLSAFAEYDDGTTENITAFANWVSSHPDNVSVNNTDKKGLLTANKMSLGANIEVSASFQKATTKIIINLVDEPLEGFTIQPDVVDLNVNDVKQFRAIAHYHSTQEDVSALSSWPIVGNSNFIELVQNLPGVVHTLREGKANIKSKFNNSEAVAEINVINGQLSPITCPVGLGGSFCGGGKDNAKDEQASQIFAGLIDTANSVRCTAVPVYYDSAKNETYLLSAAHCFIDRKIQTQDINSNSFAHIGSGKNGDKGWYVYQGVKVNYSDAGTVNSKAYNIKALYVHKKYCQGSSIVNGNCPNQALDNPNKQDNDIAIHTAGMGCGFSGNQYLPPYVAPDISTRVDKYRTWAINILNGQACDAAASCACVSVAGSGIQC